MKSASAAKTRKLWMIYAYTIRIERKPNADYFYMGLDAPIEVVSEGWELVARIPAGHRVLLERLKLKYPRMKVKQIESPITSGGLKEDLSVQNAADFVSATKLHSIYYSI